MSGNTLTGTDIESGRPIFGPAGFGKKVSDMFDDIFGTLNTIRTDMIKNGSFEDCTLADGKTPDNWTVTDYPGGTHSLDAANARIGGYALALVHPGGVNNGGGYAETDYYDVYPAHFTPNNLFLHFSWWHKASNAAMKNIFYVRFFDASHVWISDEVLWCNLDTNALGSISTYRWYCGSILPPTNAAYYKLRVVGGESTVNQAGTAWFDGILKLDTRPNLLDIGITVSQKSILGNATWADIATIQLPISLSLNETVSFDLTGFFSVFAGGSSVIASVRFRVGSSYSGEVSSGINWQSGMLSLSVKNYTPASKYLAIVVQGYAEGNYPWYPDYLEKSQASTVMMLTSSMGMPVIAV
jgi:hypothetical protein